MNILGLDVGGSGIKGAIVNTNTGELVSDRVRIPTPQPSTPENIAETVKELVAQLEWDGIVGCSFPTVVMNGKCITSGNISPEWTGVQIDELFEKYTDGLKFYVANDADLAGIAEMNLGAGKGLEGKVIMITIGTGLGSGMFYDNQLIPNIEYGRIFGKNGEPIEFWAADSARKREDLSLEKWAKRFDFFLNHVVRISSPDHFIIGGGISKKYEKFKQHLSCKTPINLAHFKNNAGIIGAAMYARTMHN